MPGIESRRIGSCACVDGSHWRARCQRDSPAQPGPAPGRTFMSGRLPWSVAFFATTANSDPLVSPGATKRVPWAWNRGASHLCPESARGSALSMLRSAMLSGAEMKPAIRGLPYRRASICFPTRTRRPETKDPGSHPGRRSAHTLLQRLVALRPRRQRPAHDRLDNLGFGVGVVLDVLPVPGGQFALRPQV
jgi:hypothetical protein